MQSNTPNTITLSEVAKADGLQAGQSFGVPDATEGDLRMNEAPAAPPAAASDNQAKGFALVFNKFQEEANKAYHWTVTELGKIVAAAEAGEEWTEEKIAALWHEVHAKAVTIAHGTPVNPIPLNPSTAPAVPAAEPPTAATPAPHAEAPHPAPSADTAAAPAGEAQGNATGT